MNNKLYLNGDDWKLTGWWINQRRFLMNMELKITPKPAVGTIPATVPGAVQADLVKAGVLKDPCYGLDSTLGEWVGNREWVYDKEFSIPEDFQGDKYVLCFEGLDYRGEIYLNGERLEGFEGMFIPVEIDVTGKIETCSSNHMRVVFFTPPEVDGQFGYSSRIRVLKSRFNYVWDWCPRIVPVGIWDDVYIKVYSFARLDDFYPKAKVVCNETSKGLIRVSTEIKCHISGEYHFSYFLLREGTKVIKKTIKENLSASKHIVQHEFTVSDIELWWPNNMGRQPLFEIRLQIHRGETMCDSVNKRIGFRTLDFADNEGSPDDSHPYTVVVNGKNVFLRGVNWVPISPFYGAVTKEDYSKYLKRLKDMNCNLVRVWGGGILEKKAFYDLCDEMGLMVWQEFPQSSSGLDNTPPDDPQFLHELKNVSAMFIKKRRHHACHVIWCGGNELMWDNFKPVNENHINIRKLKNLTEKMDKGKPFLATSASGPSFLAKEEDFNKGIHHDVHGPWNYIGEPGHYRYFNSDDSLLRSETGCPGASRMETLEKYKGDYSIWPPDESNPYWVHRGSWWIQKKQLTELFGKWREDGSELSCYLKASRFLQAEALRYAAEATRRRQPRASGFIIWMGNEPFPNNTNTSVLEYDGTPKPAYYWLKNAFRPIHVSLKYCKIHYKNGEQFTAEVYVHDDSMSNTDFKVKACIIDIYGRTIKSKNWSIKAGQYVCKVGEIEWNVESLDSRVFFVRLTLFNGAERAGENTYCFTMNSRYPLQPLRELPQPDVYLQEFDSAWDVCNNSEVAAVGVYVYGINPGDFIGMFPNYLILLPGEKTTVRMISFQGVINGLSSINVETL